MRVLADLRLPATSSSRADPIQLFAFVGSLATMLLYSCRARLMSLTSAAELTCTKRAVVSEPIAERSWCLVLL